MLAEEDLDVAREREDARVGGDDPLAHVVIAARRSLEAVLGERDRNPLLLGARVATSAPRHHVAAAGNTFSARNHEWRRTSVAVNDDRRMNEHRAVIERKAGTAGRDESRGDAVMSTVVTTSPRFIRGPRGSRVGESDRVAASARPVAPIRAGTRTRWTRRAIFLSPRIARASTSALDGRRSRRWGARPARAASRVRPAVPGPVTPASSPARASSDHADATASPWRKSEAAEQLDGVSDRMAEVQGLAHSPLPFVRRDDVRP